MFSARAVGRFLGRSEARKESSNCYSGSKSSVTIEKLVKTIHRVLS